MMKLLCIAGMFGMASAFSLDATEIGTQDTTHDEMFKAIEYAVIQKSHVTRRLGITHIVPGAETIQNALAAASPGDELVLGNGTYQLSSTIAITKTITIRAAYSRQAILDGGDRIRVMSISGGTVVLEGVIITRGSISSGAGIAIYGGDVTISNAEISSNTANSVSCLPSLSSAPLDDCNHDD